MNNLNNLNMNNYNMNNLFMNELNNYNTHNFKIIYDMIKPMNRFNQYNMNNNSNNNANTNRSNSLLTILPRDESDRKSISFCLSNGCNVLIRVNGNKTLKDLFKAFASRIGIGENKLQKKIVFLSNGVRIDMNSTQKIKEYFSNCNKIKIIVVDVGNILGKAKII